ncbi:Fur family transcriptional regulator (fragment) [Cupriavidus taiwanensis]
MWGPLRHAERLVVASLRKIGKATRPRFPDRVFRRQARPPFYSARRAGTSRRQRRQRQRPAVPGASRLKSRQATDAAPVRRQPQHAYAIRHVIREHQSDPSQARRPEGDVAADAHPRSVPHQRQAPPERGRCLPHPAHAGRGCRAVDGVPRAQPAGAGRYPAAAQLRVGPRRL